MKKLIKQTKSYLWLIPFVGFMFGYYLSYYFLQRADLVTPNIMGKNIQEAMAVLAQQKLGLRLLAERDDTARPEGTILEQIPQPDQKIRPNQNIFVTVARRPTAVLTPDFNEKKIKEVQEIAKKAGLELKTVLLKSNYPDNTCIAQYPEPNTELANKKVIVYLSAGNDLLYVMPNLTNQTLAGLEDFFKRHDNIQKTLLHVREVDPEHVCISCKVVDQSPAAGSIIDQGKPLTLTLQMR